MLYLDLSTPRVLPLIKLSSGDDDRDPTGRALTVCGEAHQPGENDLNTRPRPSVTLDAPVEIFSTTSIPAIAPYPGPGHHKSGCAEGKILNQIDVGKKLPAGVGQFLSTPRKERILNAGLGDSG